MQRRTFLKFTNVLFLPFVRVPARPVAQALLQDLLYSDSDGNSNFDSLKDGDRGSGGVVYGV